MRGECTMYTQNMESLASRERDARAARAGTISSTVVMNFTFRPPQMAIMNEFGIRRVAPARPATAGNVKSSASVYRLSSSNGCPSLRNVKL